MAQPVQEDLSVWGRDLIESIIEVLPEIIGAFIVLLLGYIIGKIIARAVTRATDRSEIDRRVLETPLGRGLGGTERAVSQVFGKTAKWFVYALAILAAANILQIQVLSEWIARAIAYLPAFFAGLAIIVLGFVLADFIGNMIKRTEVTTRMRYTSWFAEGAKFFLYFTVVVIGLDTMGVDVELLYIFARAAAWGIAAGIALALGIGVGWGMKDYISNNIEQWTSKAHDEVSEKTNDF